MERPEVTTASGNVVRLTYPETLRVLTMAWVGDVNKRVVLALLARGIPALAQFGEAGVQRGWGLALRAQGVRASQLEERILEGRPPWKRNGRQASWATATRV